MFENLFSERGFSMDRMKALIDVAQAGSISKAVRGDPVRQSQYSRQIKELEEFFGIQLTRKKGKVLTLSTAGEELVKIACEYFSTLEEFKTACKNMPRRFTIGAGDSIHHWIVSPILAKAGLEKKQWRFALKNLRNNEVGEMLFAMDIDFGILRKNLITADILKYKTIQRVKYAMYVPKAMISKGKEKDYKWCLENIPCATLALGSSFSNMLKNACFDDGYELKVALETQSFPYAAEMLKSKSFMAILPEMSEKFLPRGLVKIQPPFFKVLERDIVLAWNPRLLAVRPSIKNVLDYFIKNLSI